MPIRTKSPPDVALADLDPDEDESLEAEEEDVDDEDTGIVSPESDEQLENLIMCFLEVNESPSDAQFHSLAEACGLDKETLEAIAYKLLGKVTNDETAGVGSDDDEDDDDLEGDLDVLTM